MKNNKEHTLKLLLSALLVISTLLVIIIVIMIPDRKMTADSSDNPETALTDLQAETSLMNSGDNTDNSYTQNNFTLTEEYPDTDISVSGKTESVPESQFSSTT